MCSSDLEALNQKAGYVRGIDLTLREGEVVGLAGVVGAGRTELLRMIYGAEELESGTVYLDETPCKIDTPKIAVGHRMGFVPEDRKLEGLALIRSVGDNLALPELDIRSKAGVIDRSSVKALIDKIVNGFHIKCTSPAQLIGDLSGGNQQKAAIGKWQIGRAHV